MTSERDRDAFKALGKGWRRHQTTLAPNATYKGLRTATPEARDEDWHDDEDE